MPEADSPTSMGRQPSQNLSSRSGVVARLMDETVTTVMPVEMERRKIDALV
jgi:hypothetical protein